MARIHLTRGMFAALVVALQLVAQLALPHKAAALDNGVAALPRFGYSSFNSFGSSINETLIKELANALISTGLRDDGFNYMHLDAGALIANRTADGKLQANLTRFPAGMRALSDWLHARKFKFGMCVL